MSWNEWNVSCILESSRCPQRWACDEVGKWSGQNHDRLTLSLPVLFSSHTDQSTLPSVTGSSAEITFTSQQDSETILHTDMAHESALGPIPFFLYWLFKSKLCLCKTKHIFTVQTTNQLTPTDCRQPIAWLPWDLSRLFSSSWVGASPWDTNHLLLSSKREELVKDEQVKPHKSSASCQHCYVCVCVIYACRYNRNT